MDLRRLPDACTVSPSLSQMDHDSVENARGLLLVLVLAGLRRKKLAHLTFDFDGSVQSYEKSHP
jgi:hypothetical protein